VGAGLDLTGAGNRPWLDNGPGPGNRPWRLRLEGPYQLVVRAELGGEATLTNEQFCPAPLDEVACLGHG